MLLNRKVRISFFWGSIVALIAGVALTRILEEPWIFFGTLAIAGVMLLFSFRAIVCRSCGFRMWTVSFQPKNCAKCGTADQEGD